MRGPSHLVIGAGTGIAVAHAMDAPAAFAGALAELHPAGVALPHDVTVAGGYAFAVLAGMSVGGLTGLAPDLDSRFSVLGSRLPHWWHELTPGPRGVTHTLFGALLATVAWALLCFLMAGARPSPVIVAIFAFGYLSHLLADSVTDLGLPLFAPVWKRHLRAPVTFATGSAIEPAAAYVPTVLLLAWAFDVSHLVGRLRGLWA
jgi:membrane-bound metal-dependent hydrolase YbcI (DUF457 family)